MLFDAGTGMQKRFGRDNYLRPFFPEVGLVFFRNMTKICTNGEFAHRQTSTVFSKSILQNELVGGVDRCGLVEDFDFQQRQHWQRFCSGQSDKKLSLRVIKYEAVDYWIET